MPAHRRTRLKQPAAAPAKTFGIKKCKNCDRRFVRHRKNQLFCKVLPNGEPSNCKGEFHRNRSAFGPLKGRIEGFIREQTKDLRKRVSELEQIVAGIQIARQPDQPIQPT